MRLAFVIQRYGAEVADGPELRCRLFAEALARRSDVEKVSVYTSCALVDQTWANYYPAGTTEDAGVSIHRFPVRLPRIHALQSAIGLLTMRGPRLRGLEAPWVIAQGPYLPDLVDGLSSARRDNDAFIFCGYHCYPTVYGMPRVRDRAILWPFVRAEAQLAQQLVRGVFYAPRGLIFNSEAERALVFERFDVAHLPNCVGDSCGAPASDAVAARRMADQVLGMVSSNARERALALAHGDCFDTMTFGVITNGRRREKLLRNLDSILGLGVQRLQVLVAGKVDADLQSELRRRGVDFVADPEAANRGQLGRMRNLVVEHARHGIVAIADDDMVFHPDFCQGLRECGSDFDALAVNIRNADGSRCWDYATKGGPKGHRLLDYGEPDEHTYISGGLIVARREVLAAVRWDDRRTFYQDEDVDFSERLRRAGYRIGFCAGATVTHDDWRYTQRGHSIRRLPKWQSKLRRQFARLRTKVS